MKLKKLNEVYKKEVKNKHVDNLEIDEEEMKLPSVNFNNDFLSYKSRSRGKLSDSKMMRTEDDDHYRLDFS